VSGIERAWLIKLTQINQYCENEEHHHHCQPVSEQAHSNSIEAVQEHLSDPYWLRREL